MYLGMDFISYPHDKVKIISKNPNERSGVCEYRGTRFNFGVYEDYRKYLIEVEKGSNRIIDEDYKNRYDGAWDLSGVLDYRGIYPSDLDIDQVTEQRGFKLKRIGTTTYCLVMCTVFELKKINEEDKLPSDTLFFEDDMIFPLGKEPRVSEKDILNFSLEEDTISPGDGFPECGDRIISIDGSNMTPSSLADLILKHFPPHSLK